MALDSRRRSLIVAVLTTLLGALMWGLLAHATPAVAAPPAPAAAPERADLYFFWGEGCPHCSAAKPRLAEWGDRYPTLVVHEYEVFGSEENRLLFAQMATRQGFQPGGVPTFIMGDEHWVGFAEGRTDVALEAAISQCVAQGCPDAGAGLVTTPQPPGTPTPSTPASAPAPAPTPAPPTPSAPPASPAPPAGQDTQLDLPLIGKVDLAQQSLVVTTLLIAFVDGFNPCSLWVLTILLALTLRTGSRRIILLIGLVFITVTALVYALFIAGIFTVLTVVSIAPWVRVLVALVALAFAVINIKDYFWFKEGVSLSIPDAKKPGIYAKMRAITQSTDNLPALVAGTIALAAGVSVIELACTAGFPVIWSNILTAHQVGAATFLGLLLLYMLVYQLDELAIFGAAVITLRASKLQEHHGRILKLAGGMLMLTLAIVMIVDPTVMSGLGSSLLVFGAALAATLAVLFVHRVVLRRS